LELSPAPSLAAPPAAVLHAATGDRSRKLPEGRPQAACKMAFDLPIRFARRERIGYQVLMKRWLDDRIREERDKLREKAEQTRGSSET